MEFSNENNWLSRCWQGLHRSFSTQFAAAGIAAYKPVGVDVASMMPSSGRCLFKSHHSGTRSVDRAMPTENAIDDRKKKPESPDSR
jgi:hypothetical protein